METKICPLNYYSTVDLKGKEKFCLLSNDVVNGYLPRVSSIMPHMELSTRDEITRETRTLIPGSFDVFHIVDRVSLKELYEYCSEKVKDNYITQEQITAIVGTFEEVILPRPYLSMLGIYSALFFFKEKGKVYIADFRTSAIGNECNVDQLEKRLNLTFSTGYTCSRIILPK